MITIISGTNRKNSKTREVANHYHALFKELAEEEVKFLSLEDLPPDILNENMYAEAGQSKALAKIQDDCILPANKYFIVSPEYNGSFPGMLKLFLDAISIRQYKETFNGKKAGLAGVSSGRAGNLRGLDHLTGVLHHVGTDVMPLKLPLSEIGGLTKDGKIVDEETKDTIRAQVEAFLKY